LTPPRTLSKSNEDFQMTPVDGPYQFTFKPAVPP
jgi:hypothetical protein